MSDWGLTGAGVRAGDEMMLEGVDLPIDAGSVTVVVGGDGAGKTTLSRVLVGLLGVTAGEVRRPERSRIGYQSESSGTWQDLTVRENLEFVAVAHRLSSDERRDRIDHLIKVTELGEARDRLAADLSGGMRQKLGVVMALVHRPDLVVLDEPTTGLDPVSRTELWGVLARAAAGGAAVVVTTTYVEEAERGTTVLVLDAGRPLASGPLETVIGGAPGTVATVARTYDGEFRWRRGSTWRAWFPDGPLPAGATPITPDLHDVVTVAALARRKDGGR